MSEDSNPVRKADVHVMFHAAAHSTAPTGASGGRRRTSLALKPLEKCLQEGASALQNVAGQINVELARHVSEGSECAFGMKAEH